MTDVAVHDAAFDSKTVAVAITDLDAEDPGTSRTMALAPGEPLDPGNRSELPTNTGYTVEGTVGNGPRKTFAWDDFDVERVSLRVLVDGTRNAVRSTST